MHVKMLQSGEIKSVRPENMKKVLEARSAWAPKVSDDPEYDRVIEIFATFDTDGNGVIDETELEALLEQLKLGRAHISAFLRSADKNHDSMIQYREFVDWALSPASNKSTMSRSEVYWPDPSESGHVVDVGKDHEWAEEEADLTWADVERLCNVKTERWPPNGLKVLNNMRRRFPDYPLEGIVMKMAHNQHQGGKVLKAIRDTGTKEIDMIPHEALGAGGLGAFPAKYRAIGQALRVYREGGTNWRLQSLRDDVLPPHGTIEMDAVFTLLEVRRKQHGFCFGRVEWGTQKDRRYWVSLGLHAIVSHDPGALLWSDSKRSPEDLNFCNAMRCTD